jgi:hypothetical protein
MATSILSLSSSLVNICVSHTKVISKSNYGIVEQLWTQVVENQDNPSEVQNRSKMCCHRTEMFGVIGCEILELLLRIQQLLILPVICRQQWNTDAGPH